MSRYLLRRLIQALLMVPAIGGLAFLLVHLAPGDPIVALAGEYGDAAYYDLMRAKFGLDQPLGVQFVRYVGNVLRGDLGLSYTYGQPVATVILDRLPATILLTGSALLLSSTLGIALALQAAARPGGWLDGAISLFTLTGYAMPVFWLAQLLILLFALRLDWLPVQGMTSAREQYVGWQHLRDVATHLVLPVTALTVNQLALTTRLARTGLMEQMESAYIRTARAKGLSAERVLRRHALPNALLPVVTVIGGRVGFMVTGAVLTETVFAWPGIGQLLIAATLDRDYPILMGLFLFVAVTVLVANLLTDLAYVLLDPRVQYT